VLERVAYLNAGTDGPVPAAAAEAATAELARERDEGRGPAHFARLRELRETLRGAYAARLGADPADVSLTTSTTDGIGRVIAGLALAPGDEVVTSSDEHPGLVGPLAALRAAGVAVREVPLADVADAVGPATRLVACSHVSWVSGALAPAALAEVDVPVLLDGAQGIGAVDVDVAALGIDAYAGSGQKWLCGPDGLGSLYTSPALRERLAVTGAVGYLNLADPAAGLDAGFWEDGRRLDTGSLGPAPMAAAVAAHETLGAFGWPEVHAHAAAQAAELARRLQEAGRVVSPRDDTTLVSWETDDPEADRDRLADAGVVVRSLPGRPLVRASVGAWNAPEDLERLVSALPRL
jgi:selenocysteine lyase/cysteine desulfurase